MPERRGTRFVVEAVFLAALAAALAFAHLEALEIAGAMAAGWIVVAVLEWAVWRGEPHYGSGLPPRYFVPTVSLPPPQPLEQVERGYPGASREEAPTWIASAALRAEVLGEWPVAAPAPVEEEEGEPEFVPASAPDADPWTVVALPEEPVAPPPEEPVVIALPEEREPVGPLPEEPVAPQPEEPAAVAQPSSEETAAEQAVSEAPRFTGIRTARHTLDPLAEAAPRRRFGRKGVPEAVATVEVPLRPERARALPGAAGRQ